MVHTSCNLGSDLQFGFKKEFSCSRTLLALRSVVDYFPIMTSI